MFGVSGLAAMSPAMLQIAIPSVSDPSFWWALLVLLIIGLAVILFIGFLLAFPIAALFAVIVFFLTGSLVDAGITFLVVALFFAALDQVVDLSHRRTVTRERVRVVHEYED